MQVVVGEVVPHVAQYKTGVKREAIVTKQEPPDRQERKEKRQTHRGGHHESVFVARPGVVDAMNEEMKFGAPPIVRFPMEECSVKPILGQGP